MSDEVTILVVDDEPMMTDVIRMMLSLYLKIDPLVTNSPHEALQIMSSRPVSLLITDYYMPDMNGLELIKNARGLQLSFPIIVLTGYYDNPELKRGGAAFGAYEIVQKPWSNTRLVERIRSLLKGDVLGAKF